jgi:Na+-translocating ferredoxin:NAD+ oxidoreductase RnfE subunit
MSESIIVYRNPIEKMFWEGGYQSVALILLAIIISLVVFYFVVWLLRKITGQKWRSPTWIYVVATLTAGVSAIFIIYFCFNLF